MKFQQLSLKTCLNTCTFKLIFLHLRFYPKEEDLRNDGGCYPLLYVEKNAVPASRKRVTSSTTNPYYKDAFFWSDDDDFQF